MRSWPLKWTIPAIALVLVLLTELVIGASVLFLLQRTLTSQVDRKFDAAAASLRDIGSAATILGRGIIVLGLGVALLAAALAAWATRRSLRPLAEAERTAAAIAAGDLTRRVPSYSRATEAGSLVASINAMLDRLLATMTQRDASDARLRRFVSDASHELCTPLAAIRGYAELHRMGADESGDAVSRIEANADRMAAFVDDLLLLARSDEAAAVLSGDERVDIARILDDVAADLRAQDPSRVVSVSAEDGTVVRGSTRHLTQLFSNLAANALRHTPEGTPIELSGRLEGDHVVATVRDHGPGFGATHAADAADGAIVTVTLPASAEKSGLDGRPLA